MNMCIIFIIILIINHTTLISASESSVNIPRNPSINSVPIPLYITKIKIDKIDKENYNWDDTIFDYFENDLKARKSVVCFSLGFKELQETIGKACFTTIFEEDWSTIANTFDPEAQHIIDTQQ